MNVTIKNGSITVNGDTYIGRSVCIKDGTVTVDGVIQAKDLTGEVSVVINGDVDRLENHSGSVHAQNVGHVSTKSGDVNCGNISGSVQTMSGDVICGDVGGNVSTMSGDVSHKL